MSIEIKLCDHSDDAQEQQRTTTQYNNRREKNGRVVMSPLCIIFVEIETISERRHMSEGVANKLY